MGLKIGGNDMNLCSDDHEECCYEGRLCPTCEKQKEINDLKEAVSDLRQEVSELKDQINSLN